MLKSASLADLTLEQADQLIAERPRSIRFEVRRRTEKIVSVAYRRDLPDPHRKIAEVNYIPQVSDPPDPPRIGASPAEANRIADLIEHYIRRLASSVNDALAGSGDLLALIVDRIERADVAQELADIQSFAARLKQTTIEATATCDGDNVIAFPPQDSDEPEPAA